MSEDTDPSPPTKPGSNHFSKIVFVAIGLAVSAIGVGVWSWSSSGTDPRQSLLKARELAAQCKQSQVARQWSRMEQLAVEWARLQPEQLEPWIKAADAARQQGKLDRVADYLAKAPENCPIDVLYILSQLQLEELHQPKQAVATIERTLRRFPADAESHLRLMFLYTMTCQRDKVFDQAQKCIGSGSPPPAAFAYLLAARWLLFSNGYPLNQTWLKTDPTESQYEIAAHIHLFASDQLKEMAAQSGASITPTEFYEQLLDKVLAKYPGQAELVFTKLRFRCESGDAETVAKLLDAVAHDQTDDGRYWHYKGWYYAALEQWDQATAAYEKAIALDPFDWLTRHEYAAVLRRTAKIDAAAKMQRTAALGKEIYQTIRYARALEELTLEQYSQMINYIRECGDQRTADRLQQCLNQASLPRRP